MKISQLIERLRKIQKQEGDVEVTCTHSLLADAEHKGNVYETTVENFEVHQHERIGKCVRIWT